MADVLLLPMAKRCCYCREIKPLANFSKCSTAKDGHSRPCKSCESERHKSYWLKRNGGVSRRKVKSTDARHRMLATAKFRAKERGLEFDLTVADIVIPDECPVLGIKLYVAGGKKGPNSPSVDRINNSRGYVRGNIIVVSNRANELKRDATLAEMRALVDFYSKIMKE